MTITISGGAAAQVAELLAAHVDDGAPILSAICGSKVTVTNTISTVMHRGGSIMPWRILFGMETCDWGGGSPSNRKTLIESREVSWQESGDAVWIAI